MRKNALNFVVFLCLAGLMYFLWQQAEKNMPKRDDKKDDAKQALVEEQKKKDEQARKDKKDDAKKPEPKVGPPAPPSPPPPPAEKPTLVRLGDESFYISALLSTQGAGVQQVVLPKFGQADRIGDEVKKKDAEGNPTKDAVPLYLIPGVPQHRGKSLREEYAVPSLKPGQVADPATLAEPCYTIFHYQAPDDKTPDPLLGEKIWKLVPEPPPADGTHRVTFETELGEPYFLKFRKIYTLAAKEYHIGMRLEIERLPGGKKGEGRTKLQLSGPRGLPVDAEWSTSIYRNAVIGWWESNGTPRRQIEDGATIGSKRGGEQVVRGDNTFKYMVVANSFFASGAAIDDRADDTFENGRKHPWAYARATTELPFGVVQNYSVPYFDDITVRAVTEPLDLAPGEKIAHSYVLYNGPAKVRLLKLMSEDRGQVEAGLVDRYKDNLGLGAVTDFHSDTKLGWFLNKIWWSDLVIACTNLMHWFLALIHKVIPNWALCIVVLTICVRLMLFYPSRKQTAMSMRMMELQKQLAPELEKLQVKYKDDPGTYNREKMRLMMARGISPVAPLGGCLLFLAQAPIMMGLYFCLQESIFFRLESFLWINNLSAPDMLAWWSEKIPYLSTTEDIGSFVYLGPYFNLLPLLAVGLMLYQQAKMMPPSTDPQAEQQRVMMKMMMIFMAFFFYKVAAGLALYFIVSTAWGIIERQFIPKPKVNLDPASGGPDANGAAAGPALSPAAAAAVAAAQQRSPGLLGRLREALKKKLEEAQKRADDQSKRQIVNDPNRPGGPSDQNNGNQQGQGGNQNQNRRDKKKKRRK